MAPTRSRRSLLVRVTTVLLLLAGAGLLVADADTLGQEKKVATGMRFADEEEAWWSDRCDAIDGDPEQAMWKAMDGFAEALRPMVGAHRRGPVLVRPPTEEEALLLNREDDSGFDRDNLYHRALQTWVNRSTKESVVG